MKRSAVFTFASACSLLVLSFVLFAQETEPASSQGRKIDAASEEASRLEAELGKFKEQSPEAADVMYQLTNLYHENGRVFGLIRIAQRFAAAHPSDKRHMEVMLKLIDGLEATSRSKEHAATCRQFLARYPEATECADLEVRLCESLEEIRDWDPAGDAHRAVWIRQPNTEVGRQHGALAVSRYSYVNNKAVFSKAAELAEEMIDKLPAGQFTQEIGWQAVSQWQRGSEWAKSNTAAAKVFQKGIAGDKERQRILHFYMGENYGRLGQWANAIDSYRKAQSLRGGQDVDYRIIYSAYQNAAITPAQMQPLVDAYVKAYPELVDRWYLQGLLGLKYRAANEPEKARAIFVQLLDKDPRGNSSASYFVQLSGTEPKDNAAVEAALLKAIASFDPKRAYDESYLRYILAFSVYRDRMKDEAKTAAALRELITKTPTNDSYTQQAVDHLLYNPASDQAFASDLALIIKAQKDNLHLATFRNMLDAWVKKAKRSKDHQAHAEIAEAQLKQYESDAFVRQWIASEAYDKESQSMRDRLIKTGKVAELNDAMAYQLLYRNAYFLRHYGPNERRAESASAFGALARRFPEDYDAAVNYLSAATDYGPKELSKEAALHILKLQAQNNSADTYRRLMIAADQNEDVELLKQALTWTLAAEKKFGPSITYAYTIGDYLLKYKLEQEAVNYWESHVDVDRNHYDSRYCAERLLKLIEDPARRIAFLKELLNHESDYHGYYATLLADEHLKAGDMAQFEAVLTASKERQKERALRNWGIEDYPAQGWVDTYRSNQEATPEDKARIFTAVRDLDFSRPSATATLALLELKDGDTGLTPMQRLLAYAHTTRLVGDTTTDWDRIMPYVQSALTREDYIAAATLATGMISNIPSVDARRREAGQALVAQSYSRMGAVGLTIDENSEIAPLLQAALYLRLGDQKLALDTYTANKAMFDEHRDEVPVDLLLFVCENLIAAGGDANHERAEDILRSWIIKNSEANQFDNKTKAEVQLTLAKNFVKASRFDIARSEFTTVINRYPETPQALEAEFGIGEAFMAQKVYDQAEAVFEKLAASQEAEVVVRAEFLRGVLAHRRGDKDEARDIFRSVLERVPNIELANQALFNLAEVYGDEERYIDQLNLLRTVGRLGRSSKRTHSPGTPLSIVVQDSDLGISRGHNKIPVIVTTQPGGDRETIFLTSGGAGKGLFRVDLETRLGQVVEGDGVLQLTGRDIITSDYPEEFKQEFKRVPLSDVEIRIASDANFEASSSKIVDEENETFSERLEREAREREQADERLSQTRPSNQIKPGNTVYLKVEDFDRDLSDELDEVIVKLTAESGDEVQVALKETGSHTGVFEGTSKTAELPAGALASDTAIEHSPLMAIDQDLDSFWMSEPDGATPKFLSVDMKDLKFVSQVRISTPQADRNAPVRGDLYGSNDGRFWFRLASNPPLPEAPAATDEFGRMTQSVYTGNFTNYSNWNQVVNLSRNSEALEESEIEELAWNREADAEDADQSFGVIWQGKLVQQRTGAARISVRGQRTALWIDGQLELELGVDNRTVDLWLERGTHDLTIFSATRSAEQGVSATIARADHNSSQVVMLPFRESDFDLDQPEARPALPREPAQSDFSPSEWTFAIQPMELRYVRLQIHEYLGEAVAINNIEIRGEEADEIYIPTKADVLSLSNNSVLEIAGGDVVTAAYTDEQTQREAANSRLLVSKLTATYYDARVASIGYNFVRQFNGQVLEVPKQIMRIDPGERFIVEIIDYDHDTTADLDTIKFDVFVNDGAPTEFTATETDQYTGIFRKEIDTTAGDEPGKFSVKKGDRIYIRYIDSQNTFPGHAVPRETLVYVNTPSDAQIRILETRVIPGNPERNLPPRYIYRNPPDDQDVSKVAFEAPFTVEVIDPDAAKDSTSEITVKLTTSAGAEVDVRCVVSGAFSSRTRQIDTRVTDTLALEEGRFIGQCILQLGGNDSPSIVPISADMPRNLIGGTALDEEGEGSALDRSLVTRVLNLTGKDSILAGYKDELRVQGAAKTLSAQGRLISNGLLACTDRDYNKPVTQLHVGEKIFLMVNDPDQDSSDERDYVEVEVTSEFGEREMVPLAETLAHSGIFTGSFRMGSSEKPTPGNLNGDEPTIECYFGDTIHLKYVDPAASTESGDLELEVEVPVVVGTDGLVSAFSKTFNDETLAVETKFHVAESYFELFKSHKELGRNDEQNSDLEAGRRVLQEVMEDYPDPKYVPRIAYLLGQFAQELEQWDEAVDSYRLIVEQYPDHSLAPDAQYKLAQSHEERGDFDEALEAYVTLAATYPKSPLIASVMIRICDHFYKAETFDIASQVGEKFLEKFENHQHASRIAFRIGQCFYKAEAFNDAGAAFDRFAKIFPDDELSPDALFWAGESFRMANNNREAFRRYNNCRWNFPESEAAKYSRGRLALPEMIQQFEAEARALENPN